MDPKTAGPGGDVTELPKVMTTAQPRARGEVRAAFDTSRGMTRLVALRQSGSSRALFPRTRTASLQMVLTNKWLERQGLATFRGR